MDTEYYKTNTKTSRISINKAIQLLCFIVLISLSNHLFAQSKALMINITSVTSGIISKIHVQEQQMVKKGDLLIDFDASLVNSSLIAAKAKLQLNQLNLREAKKEFQRSEELYERTVLSEHDLQLAKVSYYKALSEKSAADNHLTHLKWEQKEHKVYAPFDAKVLKVLCYEGQYINNQYSAQSLLSLQK